MRFLFLLGKRFSAAPTLIRYNRRTFTSCTRKIKFQPLILISPWSATQLRCARFTGSDVKPGNVIERKGKIYQVIHAERSNQGRGGAIIQVELRDVDNGSKSNERIRTDEAVEKIHVRDVSLTYSYTDDETGNIVLMDPETYSQLEVPKHFFGKSIVYLQDDMNVTVQIYDERPVSASVPTRVTCKVAEASDAVKGSKGPRYKVVVLDNGETVEVPAHVVAGDEIIIDTNHGHYISKA